MISSSQSLKTTTMFEDCEMHTCAYNADFKNNETVSFIFLHVRGGYFYINATANEIQALISNLQLHLDHLKICKQAQVAGDAA